MNQLSKRYLNNLKELAVPLGNDCNYTQGKAITLVLPSGKVVFHAGLEEMCNAFV